MSEPTIPAGATPAAGGATPPQTPPAASAPVPTPQVQPTAVPAPDPAAPDDSSGLGDAGKRALDAMKAERNAAIAAPKAAERQLEQIKAASLSESEKAIAAARNAGADEVTERLNARIRRAEMKLALARACAVSSLIEDPANAAEFAALVVDDADHVAGLNDAIKAHKARVPDAYRPPTSPGPGSRSSSQGGRSCRRDSRRRRMPTAWRLRCPPRLLLARPTGVGRALATYEIPIEGRDEWLAAARRLA